MPNRLKSCLVALALAGLVAGQAVPARAVSPGSGTFTTITTPAHDVLFHYRDGMPNHLTVSGSTSTDVTAVDIDCVYLGPTGDPFVTTLAAAVPVSGGSFGTTVSVDRLLANCRLRAIPTTEPTPYKYLGAYAGPVLTMWGAQLSRDAGTPYGFIGTGENAQTIGIVADAGECGPETVASLASPAMRLEGLTVGCLLALPGGNRPTGDTSTASSVRVDGHNAYTPFAVHALLRGTQTLTVGQTAISVTVTRAGNGDVTFTEHDPLVRCNVDDTYPPTNTSCTALVPTGVTLNRVMTYQRGGRQISVRDSYSSSGGPHAVSVTFVGSIQRTSPDRGNVGFSFPGRPVEFGAGSPNTTIGGFGPGARTLLIRGDLHAAADDPSAPYAGFTWSRPPVFRFGTDPDTCTMHYDLAVPAHGSARLGFAWSGGNLLGQVQPLARAAEADMMSAPTITSPANRARIAGKSTTVKGTLVAGANGLPTLVSVNGHNAKITKTGVSTAKFAVTFNESLGKHTITVTAKDNGGNTRSRSITVTNG